MKTPFYANSPTFLIPSDEARLLRGLEDHQALKIVSDGFTALIHGEGWVIACSPEPGLHGASPYDQDTEELMRLRIRETYKDEDFPLGNAHELKLGAVIESVALLHSFACFGMPENHQQAIVADVDLGPAIGYSYEQLGPAPSGAQVTRFKALASLGLLNQVDVGVRLRFAGGRSVSVGTNGCNYHVGVHEGDDQAEYLELTLEVPLGERL